MVGAAVPIPVALSRAAEANPRSTQAHHPVPEAPVAPKARAPVPLVPAQAPPAPLAGRRPLRAVYPRQAALDGHPARGGAHILPRPPRGPPCLRPQRKMVVLGCMRDAWTYDSVPWDACPEGKERYCVGFMFSPYMEVVALIRKKRPEWQAGLLNGVGGRLREGETPLEGMRREFREEAGVAWDEWMPLARLDFPEATVWFFWARGGCVWECRTQTDEAVSIHRTRDVQDLDLVPNARWLIPMATSFTRGEGARCFTVQEVY